MSEQRPSEQKIALANALVGKRVRFNHMTDRDARTVLRATEDGMVEVEGFGGQFAPHLFKIVQAQSRQGECPSGDYERAVGGSNSSPSNPGESPALLTSNRLVERLRAEYARTGAYAPEATCKHGIHPYDCRQGCAPPTFEAADEIERLRNEITDLQGRNGAKAAELERLRRQDEVHWKTRRSLLKDNERLRRYLTAIDQDYVSAEAMRRCAQRALRPEPITLLADETSRCAECGLLRDEHDDPNEFVPAGETVAAPQAFLVCGTCQRKATVTSDASFKPVAMICERSECPGRASENGEHPQMSADGGEDIPL